LSRHRKVQLSRSKALLVAAGALSVATAASTTAATWTSGPAAASAQAGSTRAAAGRGHQAILSARETSDVLRLTIPVASPRSAAKASASRAAELKTEMAAVQTPAATASPTAAASPTASPTGSRAATASPTATPQPTPTATASAPSGSPRQIAQAMLGSFGWSSSQFACLDPLWAHESGWSVTAHNASSGAYGIPQALPGSKMASAGPDWQTNATTQIKWGLRYIKGTYGSPCAAYSHEQSTGWY
jgi:hypothetical protein